MSVRLSRRSALFASGGAAALASRPAWAQTPANDDAGSAEAVDAFVRQCMAAWPEQPALGIAVVRDGRPLLRQTTTLGEDPDDGLRELRSVLDTAPVPSDGQRDGPHDDPARTVVMDLAAGGALTVTLG